MKLGITVTDRITGVSGIVTGYVTYITGCSQALVAPKVGKDGIMKDSAWIDEQRLIADTKVKPVEIDNSFAKGPDKSPPKR